MKRSSADDEAIRRADAEGEKALKRAREIEERRAATRASASSVQELEESMEQRREHPAASGAMMVAAEAALAETRETLKALTVSALQRTHAMIHRTDTTAVGLFLSSQGHDCDHQGASTKDRA